MYCSRTLTPSGGRVEQLRGGALGAMTRTKKVLTRAEAKAMALRDGVEQVVLTQDVDDMQRVANERKERAEEARRRLRSSRRKGGEARQGCKTSLASVAIALVVVHHHPKPSLDFLLLLLVCSRVLLLACVGALRGRTFEFHPQLFVFMLARR